MDNEEPVSVSDFEVVYDEDWGKIIQRKSLKAFIPAILGFVPMVIQVVLDPNFMKQGGRGETFSFVSMFVGFLVAFAYGFWLHQCYRCHRCGKRLSPYQTDETEPVRYDCWKCHIIYVISKDPTQL